MRGCGEWNGSLGWLHAGRPTMPSQTPTHVIIFNSFPDPHHVVFGFPLSSREGRISGAFLDVQTYSAYANSART